MTDYDEALLIIANPDSMLLPERRHLLALYKRIWELEQDRKMRDERNIEADGLCLRAGIFSGCANDPHSH